MNKNVLKNAVCILCFPKKQNSQLCVYPDVNKQLTTFWATVISLVLMHSGIVNGHQLLCVAHTVLEPQRGTAAFFLFYSLSCFSTFSFYVFVTLTVPISFLGFLVSLC